MRQTNIAGIEFNVNSYVGIEDFNNLMNSMKENPSIVAAIIACIEGIIKPDKSNDCYSFAGIYKVKCSNKYSFLNICSFINKNKKVYDYIVNYFNLWHNGNCEEFSQDEFTKNDIINNLFEFVTLLCEERNMAIELNDIKEAKEYKTIFNKLSELFSISSI